MKKTKISRVITIRLFIAVFIAFVVSTAVIYGLLMFRCVERANTLLKYTDFNFINEFEMSTGANIYESCRNILDLQDRGGIDVINDYFKNSNYTYLAKRDGTIEISGNKDFIGKNIRDIPLVSEMLDQMVNLVDNNEQYGNIMTPKPVKTIDGKMEVYYIMAIKYPDSVILYALSPEDYVRIAVAFAQNVSNNLGAGNIGMRGGTWVIDEDLTILTNGLTEDKVFTYTDIIEKYDKGTDKSIVNVDTSYMFLGEKIETTERLLLDRGTFYGEDCFYCLNKRYGAYILTLYPAGEALEQVNDTIVFIVLIEVLVFAVLFIVLHLLIKRRMVNNLNRVNKSLAAITEGNLEEKVEVRDTYEFDTLSTDINSTVDRLKGYIAEAAARIDADLEIAKSIQTSQLPSEFPPFPEHKEFELFASMEAAKEVGGDFYDYYMIDDNTLGFLIADVSGKSIPGAMFMMTSKSVIKGLAERGLPVNEVFTQANEKLCEGNDAEMFVTAWLGYLDLQTGLVKVANGGHNPPVLIRDGKAEYVILKPGLILAELDDIKYKEQEVQLQKGDILFLYTDGVTEAMDVDENLYGEKRLINLLSFGDNYPEARDENGIAGAVCEMVSADIKEFVQGAEQSDDITMLCVRYL